MDDQVGPVTAAVARHVTAGQLTTVFAQVPDWLREVLDRDAETAGPEERDLAGQSIEESDAAAAVGLAGGLEGRVDSLNGEVRALTEAVRVLAAGLEEIPPATARRGERP